MMAAPACMVVRFALALALLALSVAGQAQQFGPAEFVIGVDDGTLMTNHRIASECAAAAERLPGVQGGPRGTNL